MRHASTSDILSDTGRSDAGRSDVWPDWSGAVEDPAVVARRAEENSARRVFFEIGLVLGGALGLAAIVSLLVGPNP